MNNVLEANTAVDSTYADRAVAGVWGSWPPPATTAANSASGTQMAVVRILVVDGHANASHGLAWELRREPDFEIVGQAQTGAAAVALAQQCRPDIVVVDMEMPSMDGVQATEHLHALAPNCLIMLLTVRDSIETHARARAAGARVVVEKGNPNVFRHAFHQLAEFAKTRNLPAWPGDAAPAQ